MSFGEKIVSRSVKHYKLLTWIVVVATLLLAVLAGAPSIFPDALSFMNPVTVDTDPENMLSADEPVRVFHNRMKRTLNLYDMVVVGVVNDRDPNGVFNAATLGKVHALAEYARTLKGAAIGQPEGSDEGVVEVDLLAPSTVDAMEPTAGGVSFDWLMKEPPADDAQAMEVWRKARRIPFLFGTMLSDKDPARPGKDITGPSKAITIYLPLTRKDLSHAVYVKLQEKTAQLGGPEQYYVTGLPVAEDTFGVEMFIQMAISAPAAMVVIFLLMLVFFRKLVVVVSPMIVALVSVIFTMASLIIAGFPVHIMSSMIPIFIMPIAVLDSIHIISEFFERYQATRDREKTIRTVMDELFSPMLYTSLTSAAGFASLALTPIPPVQVFGIFVAVGIMVAWLLTVTFIPAFVMFISPKSLANFGATHAADDDAMDQTALGRLLRWVATMTYRRAKPILAVTMVVLAVAGYGISRININDNPVKWFEPAHPIRQADTVLNGYFGGTYMAYLAMQHEPEAFDANAFAADLHGQLARRSADTAEQMTRLGSVAVQFGATGVPANRNSELFLAALKRSVRPDSFTATSRQLGAWKVPDRFLDVEADRLTPGPGKPGQFDGPKYAQALTAIAVQHAKRFADNIRKLDGLVDEVAASGPGSRDKMLAALAQRFSGTEAPVPARPAVAPKATDTPTEAPGGEPDLPTIESPAADEPDLPAIGLPTAPAAQGKADVYAAIAADAVGLFIDEIRQQSQVFKRPDVLEWMARLQIAMSDTGTVGKSNSLADMVKTVQRDLRDGDEDAYRVPVSAEAVGQCILQYGNSHRPDDLWHFVTPDYQLSSIWVQLTSGDNRDMQKVVADVDKFLAGDPAPVGMNVRWFGLTYINVEWQDKMVTGMIEAFSGSFLVVFLLMVILFRSVLWGLLSMIPLTVTIAAIYGTVGLVGKDYDMPTAVLSSLTLGLAVDFAIHFLARSRTMHARYGSWQKTLPHIFGEPARAITRNIVVIAAGFLPLLLAPLMPYKTVGILLAVILLVSGACTLLLLPALIRVLERRLFTAKAPMAAGCNCGVCIVSAIAAVAVIVMGIKHYVPWHWTALTAIGAAFVPVAAVLCGILSRRRKCKLSDQGENQ